MLGRGERPGRSPLVLRSLREQVYDHLRLLADRGELRPGAPLDLATGSCGWCGR